MKKNKGFSLVEIMVVLAALAGVALLVTKLGKNSMSIQNESITNNDYNDLVRESHFLISNLKSCKVSLNGVTFPTSALTKPITQLELWTSDSRGLNKVKKKIAKGEKFGTLLIEDVQLAIDPVGAEQNNNPFKSTTGVLKIILAKTKTKNPLLDIDHSINLNFSSHQTEDKSTLVDCEEEHESKEKASVWCGRIQNPCGPEIVSVVAIGKYIDGKFTGIFQAAALSDFKLCTSAVNHPAEFTVCQVSP